MTHWILTDHPPNFLQLNSGRPHRISRSKVNPKLIEVARSELGFDTIQRFPVDDHQVAWEVGLPKYTPNFIDAPRGKTHFRKRGDRSDPDDPNKIMWFASLEVHQVHRDAKGYPLNPIGRTGICGRGMLDRWGATPAADLILTRHNNQKGLEVLLIQRNDTREWALPGGKVNIGEEPWQAARRELTEETGLKNIELDSSLAHIIFAGYADDSRNTDNAWMESTVFHYHLNPERAHTAVLEAGDDADFAAWTIIDPPLYSRLFASHAQYLHLAVENIQNVIADNED